MIESIEAALFPIVCKINEYLSNYILVFLLLGIGFWYSIKTRFVQIRCFKEGWNSVFGNLSLRGKKHDSGMSSFQALATAIAAQVGTGNIVGASGAILTGGPGAIFWMWLAAFFGMATIFAELRSLRCSVLVTHTAKLWAARPSISAAAPQQAPCGLLCRLDHHRARLHRQHGSGQLHCRRLPQSL